MLKNAGVRGYGSSLGTGNMSSGGVAVPRQM
jgi:hypothetical protein